VTLSEFARHVGVSRQAVAKVVAKGGLGDLVVRSEGPKGKPVCSIVDVERATAVWRSRPGQASTQERDLNGQMAVHAKAGHSGPVSPARPARARAHQPQPDDDGQEERDPLESIAEARLQKEAYQAKLARQEFEREAGLLVETARVMEIYGRQIQSAKAKIMALGRLARSRIPHLGVDDVLTIEDLCREALEELAAEAIQADAPAPGGGEP
jgi:hypothetical protein